VAATYKPAFLAFCKPDNFLKIISEGVESDIVGWFAVGMEDHFIRILRDMLSKGSHLKR